MLINEGDEVVVIQILHTVVGGHPLGIQSDIFGDRGGKVIGICEGAVVGVPALEGVALPSGICNAVGGIAEVHGLAGVGLAVVVHIGHGQLSGIAGIKGVQLVGDRTAFHAGRVAGNRDLRHRVDVLHAVVIQLGQLLPSIGPNRKRGIQSRSGIDASILEQIHQNRVGTGVVGVVRVLPYLVHGEGGGVVIQRAVHHKHAVLSEGRHIEGVAGVTQSGIALVQVDRVFLSVHGVGNHMGLILPQQPGFRIVHRQVIPGGTPIPSRTDRRSDSGGDRLHRSAGILAGGVIQLHLHAVRPLAGGVVVIVPSIQEGDVPQLRVGVGDGGRTILIIPVISDLEMTGYFIAVVIHHLGFHRVVGDQLAALVLGQIFPAQILVTVGNKRNIFRSGNILTVAQQVNGSFADSESSSIAEVPIFSHTVTDLLRIMGQSDGVSLVRERHAGGITLGVARVCVRLVIHNDVRQVAISEFLVLVKQHRNRIDPLGVALVGGDQNAGGIRQVDLVILTLEGKCDAVGTDAAAVSVVIPDHIDGNLLLLVVGRAVAVGVHGPDRVQGGVPAQSVGTALLIHHSRHILRIGDHAVNVLGPAQEGVAFVGHAALAKHGSLSVGLAVCCVVHRGVDAAVGVVGQRPGIGRVGVLDGNSRGVAL